MPRSIFLFDIARMTLPVTQIFISDDDATPLPPALSEAVQSVRRAFPGAQHRLFTHATLRAFIAERFGGDVLRAYDCLKPYAYKADLGRLCVVHALGGWYFDLPTRLPAPIAVAPEVQAILFRDINLMLPYGWGVTNATFHAKAGARFLGAAIDLVVDNCRRRDYCATPFSVTGPGVLGRALAQVGETAGYIYGDRVPLTPLHPKKNFAYVMPDGSIAGFAKQVGNGGDLAAYGATGTNDYKKMWAARDVFGPF